MLHLFHVFIQQMYILMSCIPFCFQITLTYDAIFPSQGSTDYSPQTTAMRAVIAFFWFCVLIIEAAYTANLAAYLTLQQMDDRIKSIDDLAGQTKQRYAVERDSDIMHFFSVITFNFMQLKNKTKQKLLCVV